MRRDGVLHDVQRLGLAFQAGVLSRLKVVAGLDIAERRLPQDGRARVNVDARDIDIRVSTLPALHGESLVLRLLDSGGAHARSLADLGISAATRAAWTHLVSRSSGLLLVTGPTGSGKTTTLYAALADRSTPGVKVVTVEDPVEYRLDGVVQLPVNAKAGFGFANALRAILRHDPDVILVGEMRDADTAEIAVQAALTGHLVLSTLHTTDATGALARMTEMGVPPYLLAATLQGVLAQRLVRMTCEHCGSWRALSSEETALQRAVSPPVDPAVTQVREGSGCEQCAHTGYRGRAAITELLVLDDALRAAFADGASLDVLRSTVRARGIPSLLHDGWRAVRDGRTTITELTRVVSEDESA
jgi:type II secretory ATPase GspE/PulE/Tfp pilus assembly ATPase PilB-like protein